MTTARESEVAAAIEKRMTASFNTIWARQPAVLVIFANTKVKEPEPPFVRFYVRHDLGTDGVGIAGNRIDSRKLGMLTAQIFTKVGIGERQGREIGGVIKTIFERQQFDGVTCREYMLREVGVDQREPALYQFNARVLFDYHDSVTY